VEDGIRALRDAKTYMCALAGDSRREWSAWDEVGAQTVEVLLCRSIELRNQMIRDREAAAVGGDAA
jgi:hypothetical protein